MMVALALAGVVAYAAKRYGTQADVPAMAAMQVPVSVQPGRRAARVPSARSARSRRAPRRPRDAFADVRGRARSRRGRSSPLTRPRR
ncbi:MAG: hypothetical protein U0326_24690 [Polyangiales bacterium]